MLKSIFTLILAGLFFPVLLHSQPAMDSSFTALDSFSRTVRYKQDIYRLTKELTEGYPGQLQKARAIFIWITDNIRYDHKFINKGKEIKIPECESGIYCEQIHQEWEKKYLQRILRKKLAICDGYARLYKKMCEISGIRCEIVAGYSRTKPYQIGNAGSVDHAWNALWVDSALYFADPTWAAGGCEEDEETGMLLRFRKQFKEYYWCTPFDDLARNHYPKDGKWVVEAGYTKEKYAANPYYSPSIISDIHLLSPASGIIRAVSGDTLHFVFAYKGDISKLQVNSNVLRNPALGEWEKKHGHRKIWKSYPEAMKKQRYVDFKKSGDTYSFDYIVPDNSLYYIELLFDYKKVMRFNVSIDSQ